MRAFRCFCPRIRGALASGGRSGLLIQTSHGPRSQLPSSTECQFYHSYQPLCYLRAGKRRRSKPHGEVFVQGESPRCICFTSISSSKKVPLADTEDQEDQEVSPDSSSHHRTPAREFPEGEHVGNSSPHTKEFLEIQGILETGLERQLRDKSLVSPEILGNISTEECNALFDLLCRKKRTDLAQAVLRHMTESQIPLQEPVLSWFRARNRSTSSDISDQLRTDTVNLSPTFESDALILLVESTTTGTAGSLKAAKASNGGYRSNAKEAIKRLVVEWVVDRGEMAGVQLFEKLFLKKVEATMLLAILHGLFSADEPCADSAVYGQTFELLLQEHELAPAVDLLHMMNLLRMPLENALVWRLIKSLHEISAHEAPEVSKRLMRLLFEGPVDEERYGRLRPLYSAALQWTLMTRQVEAAEHIFINMLHRGVPPNVMDYTNIMRLYLGMNDLSTVEYVWNKMLEKGIRPDATAHVVYLDHLFMKEELRPVMDHLNSLRDSEDRMLWPVVMDRVIAHLAEAGNAELTKLFMRKCATPNTSFWKPKPEFGEVEKESLSNGLGEQRRGVERVHSNDMDGKTSEWGDMGIPLDRFTWWTVLQLLADQDDPSVFFFWLQRMYAHGVQLDTTTGASLISSLANRGFTAHARELFSQCKEARMCFSVEEYRDIVMALPAREQLDLIESIARENATFVDETVVGKAVESLLAQNQVASACRFVVRVLHKDWPIWRKTLDACIKECIESKQLNAAMEIVDALLQSKQSLSVKTLRELQQMLLHKRRHYDYQKACLVPMAGSS